jgi:hypothetical protein
MGVYATIVSYTDFAPELSDPVIYSFGTENHDSDGGRCKKYQ